MKSTPSVTHYRAKCKALGQKRRDQYLTDAEWVAVVEFIKALRAAAKGKQ